MLLRFICINIILLFWVKLSTTVSNSNKNMFFTDASREIADFVSAKRYIPNEKQLSNSPLIKNIDNDATYILSKLSDNELLKLLNEQPQINEFNLNDIVRILFDIKSGQNNRLQSHNDKTRSRNQLNNFQNSYRGNNRFHTVTNSKTINNNDKTSAYFKLNHRAVEYNKDKYLAFQKLKNLLNVYLKSKTDEIIDVPSEEKKELLFDILVAQLKSLCCKRPQKLKTNEGQYKTEPFSLLLKYNNNDRLYTPFDTKPSEFMFLILNDELKSNGSDELMAVDPESLSGNSSVLLLGPVTAQLSDQQLKLVMNRISYELSRPEYLSLLQHLSNGVLLNNNKNVIQNVVFGPETRRYIKPHRCNQQSKLAKVYGGPKWIVCTGYLNINKPSLYD